MTAARSSGCPGRFLRPIRPRFFLFRFSGAPAAFHPRFSFPLFRGAGHLLTVPPPPPGGRFLLLAFPRKMLYNMSRFIMRFVSSVSALTDGDRLCRRGHCRILPHFFGRLRKSAVKVSKKAKNKTARIPVRRRSARVRTDPLSAWPDALFR